MNPSFSDRFKLPGKFGVLPGPSTVVQGPLPRPLGTGVKEAAWWCTQGSIPVKSCKEFADEYDSTLIRSDIFCAEDSKAFMIKNISQVIEKIKGGKDERYRII